MPPLPKAFGAGGILFRVCPSVSEYVRESVRPKTTISQEPILVIDVFGFIDVLIDFGVKRSVGHNCRLGNAHRHDPTRLKNSQLVQTFTILPDYARLTNKIMWMKCKLKQVA